MKSIVLFIVAVAVFGTAGYFAYHLYVKPQKELAVEIEIEEEKIANPTPPPVDPSIAVFDQAIALKDQGKLLEASTALRNFVSTHPTSPKIYEAVDALGEVNTDILFSDVKSPEKSEYVVVSGDTLGRIAKRQSTTAEMLMRVNDMSGTMLRIGDRLLVPKQIFSLRIYIAAKVVDVYDGDKFFKRYQAVGMNNLTAPIAGKPINLVVKEKIAWNSGKRVAFGSEEFMASSRWIMLSDRSYSLYSDAGESGNVQNPGRGVELRDEDIEELHTMLRNNSAVLIE